MRKRGLTSSRRTVVMYWLTAIALVVAGCTSGTGSDTTASPVSTTTDPAPTTTPDNTGSTSQPENTTTSEAGGELSFPEPEVDVLRVGATGGDIIGLPFVVAQSRDLYEKYGLTVEASFFDSDLPMIQALRAGQVDIVMSSGIPVVASLQTPEPLMHIYLSQGLVKGVLATRADVTTADDLVGEPIAISQFGAQSHAQVVLALEQLGLSQDDVTITQIGGGGERLAALQGGSVAAAPLDASEVEAAVAAGELNILVDLSEVTDSGLAGIGAATSSAFLEENPNTALAFVAAQVEGLTLMLQEPQAAAEAFAEANGITVDEATTALEAALQGGWEPRDGLPDVRYYEIAKETLTAVDSEFAEVDVSNAFTTAVVDELIAMGFLESIGAPADVPETVG